MNGSVEEQIRELVKSGRISSSVAKALTEHYSKQNHLTRNSAGVPSAQVNLMELMNIIDLLEKKKELPLGSNPVHEPHPQKVHSLGASEQFLHENKEEYLVLPETDKAGFDKKRLEARIEELRLKCDKLEAELAAEKEAHKESSKIEFVYAKRYADSQEERRQAQADEKKKRKALEAENGRLSGEIKRMREAEEKIKIRAAELEALASVTHPQTDSFEERRVSCEAEMAITERVRNETEKALREEIRGLEAKCAEKEAELKARGTSDAELSEKHRSAPETHEKECLALAEEKSRLDAEKKTLALELAEKGREVAQLKTGLQEAQEISERFRGQILELEKALQEAKQSFEALREEKDRLGIVKPCAPKEGDEKTSGLDVLKQERDQLAGEVEKNCKETREALARVRSLEEAAAQTESMRKQCSDFKIEMDKRREETDEKIRMVQALTEVIRSKEELLREKEITQEALEEKLAEEMKAHANAQAQSRKLEAALLALEEKIDELISPPASEA